MARPTDEDVPRSERVYVRLTPAEKDALALHADAAGLPLSEYVRRRAVHGTRVVAKGDLRLRAELGRLGGQIKRALRDGVAPDDAVAREALRAVIRAANVLADGPDSGDDR